MTVYLPCGYGIGLRVADSSWRRRPVMLCPGRQQRRVIPLKTWLFSLMRPMLLQAILRIIFRLMKQNGRKNSGPAGWQRKCWDGTDEKTNPGGGSISGFVNFRMMNCNRTRMHWADLSTQVKRDRLRN